MPPFGSSSGAESSRLRVSSDALSWILMASGLALKSFVIAARTSVSLMPNLAERKPSIALMAFSSPGTAGVSAAAVGVAPTAAAGAARAAAALGAVFCFGTAP